MSLSIKLSILLLLLLPLMGNAQSTYFIQSEKDNHSIDRFQIIHNNSNINFFTIKPFNRKSAVQELLYYTDSIHPTRFSNIDAYNMAGILMNNAEYLNREIPESKSIKPLLNSFYRTKTDFFKVNIPEFYLSVNPMLNIQVGKSSGLDQQLYLNSRGVNLRGIIGNKVGFFSSVTENQERGPLHYQQYVRQSRAVPGVGFYKLVHQDPSAFDYFDARGYFTFNAAKHFDFQFGYDKNFIGNGYRSLFLSDWGNSYLFAKINTRIWKLNYQNLFTELMPQFVKNGDTLISRKYAAIHHLSINVSKNINLGFFEAIVFGRKDHFDFQYLNPIIFYRHIEGSIGSPDNAFAGFDFKANFLHRTQLYGQLLLDEFILSKLKNQPHYWANKFGIQLGAKYINAFGIKNLDLQVELNRVRPFTYSHNDTIANYTHYNQPLAHPLGANFQEIITLITYQPFPKWNVNAKAIYYNKGVDTGQADFGGNIFKNYNSRNGEDGFTLGNGVNEKSLNLMLNVGYEWKRNLFLEMSVQNRTYRLETENSNSNAMIFSTGIRLNMDRKSYDY